MIPANTARVIPINAVDICLGMFLPLGRRAKRTMHINCIVPKKRKTGTGDGSFSTKIKRDAIPMKKKRVEKARSAYFLNEAFIMITPPNNQKITLSSITVFQKYAFYLQIYAFNKQDFGRKNGK